MNEKKAKEIVAHPGIYCDVPDKLSHHQDYSMAVGYLKCLEQLKPVIEKARHALTISRAANNKTELWEAWADNLEQEMKNVLSQWDESQK